MSVRLILMPPAKTVWRLQPARKPHIVLQDRLIPGEEHNVAIPLEEGRYRARLQGSQSFFWLQSNAIDGLPRLQWEAGSTVAGRSVNVAPNPVLELKNSDARAHTFVIDRTDADSEVLRPGDLFALPDYRHLYPDEQLPGDLKIDIGVQTILFTDIVGSSKMYKELGDTGAFRRVRDHFASIGEIIESFDGAVIKTVGDAVFAVFGNQLDAYRAGLELRKRFLNPESEVAIRISLHTGPCLAVNLDTGIDYFGNTVNLSAKLQALAGAGQIAFTGAALENSLVRDEFRRVGLKPQEVSLPESLGWIPDRVFRV